MTTPIPAAVRLAVFLRSFLIQGSWNYRTMIGGGFGFAILPALRWVCRGRPEELESATRRHTEHFNAHPYMAGLALGSTVRLEAEGTPADSVRRFKAAVRGPLGGLGDRLVWAGWLPLTVLLGLLLLVHGAPPAVVVITFLVVYNAGHVAFRLWAFRTGLEAGAGLARSLQSAELKDRTDRVHGMGTLMLGLVAGSVAADVVTQGMGGVWVATAASVSFILGARLGPRAWRPTAGGLTLVILLMTLAGTIL